MENVDWSPLLNAVIPTAAALITAFLGILTSRIYDYLGVKRDDVLQNRVADALEFYAAYAAKNKVDDPASLAAEMTQANLPDSVRKLKATVPQLERKAAAILAKGVKA